MSRSIKIGQFRALSAREISGILSVDGKIIIIVGKYPRFELIALDGSASLDNSPAADDNEGKEATKPVAEILKPKDYLEELYD